MRLLHLFSFLFITIVSHGQVSKQLEGNWKVIAIRDSEMTVDFKKGTIIGAALDKLDSSARKEFIEVMLSGLGSVIYSFDPKGRYRQKHENTLDGEGTWEITEKTALLILKGLRNNSSFVETWTYRFEGKGLILTEQKEDTPMTLTLERH